MKIKKMDCRSYKVDNYECVPHMKVSLKNCDIALYDEECNRLLKTCEEAESFFEWKDTMLHHFEPGFTLVETKEGVQYACVRIEPFQRKPTVVFSRISNPKKEKVEDYHYQPPRIIIVKKLVF